MLIRKATDVYRPVPAPRPRTADERCAPSCPECGGLECLCRPRFFAGQLLTEEDLNRLDHYVVEKNKLHNRYLHGWGVVCGLEVLCHPCDDRVIVRPGYALSPCGEDIVVCGETSVAVCDLIKACNDQERRRWECEPYPYGRDDDCKDQCQDWVLSVRYDEKPSRGVSALPDSQGGCCSSCSGGSTGCGCGGSCGGGSGNGGCSCGQKSNGTSKSKGSASGARRTPLQCEPTTTCEGFKFEVSRYKPNRTVNDSRPSLTHMGSSYVAAGQSGTNSRIDGLRNCLQELVESLPTMPGEGLTSQELYTRCCQAKESLHEYFQEHPSYDCQMDEKLAGIRCPRPSFERDENEAEYRREIYDTITSLISLGRKYLDYCLCSSLLPPCPEPVEDPRVPLAVITVCGDECKLMRVCNLDVRQYVITFPMIQHYLNGLGLGGAIMERLKAFCCPRDEVDPRPRRQILTADVQPMVADRSEMPAIGNFVTRSVRRTPRVRTAKSGAQDFSKLLLGAMAEPDRGLDTFKLLAGAMGAVDESGTPLATNLEIENPLQALMINGLVAPLLQNFIPQHLANATQARAARAAGPDTQEETKEAAIARMQSELEALRKTSAEQQENINMLLGDLKKLIETDNGPQSTGDK